MARNRVTYQAQAAFVGPAIISGTESSPSHKNPRSLERVQTLDYSFNIDRADVAQVGKIGFAARPIIEQPTVNIELSYVLGSFKNEQLFGFDFNHQSGQNGTPSQSDNFEQSLISSFANTGDRNLDRRNFYIAVMADEGVDAHNGWYAGVIDKETDVIAVSNCYLSRYSSTANVGGLIENSVSLQGSSIEHFKNVNLGTETIDMPIIHYKQITGQDTKAITIPPYDGTTAGDNTTVLKAYDTKVTVTELNTQGNLGLSIQDLKIQSYTLDLDLHRESLRGIGYKMPIDSPLVQPSQATLSVDAIVSDSTAGSLSELRANDDKFDVSIDIYRSRDCPATGIATGVTSELANRYILKSCHLERATYQGSVGENKKVTLGFAVDMDHQDMSKGLFLSGQINI
jgi:hypothetical protein